MTLSDRPATATLGTAHLAFGLVALAAALMVAAAWPTNLGNEEYRTVAVPAHCAVAAGVAYLVLRAAGGFRLGGRLRRGESDIGNVSPRAVQDISLVAMLGAVLARGDQARTYLAGLDLLVACLAAVTVLSLLLTVGDVRLARRRESPATRKPGGLELATLGVWLAVVGCLVYLEWQPLPR